jgi:hypothetical protein
LPTESSAISCFARRGKFHPCRDLASVLLLSLLLIPAMSFAQSGGGQGANPPGGEQPENRANAGPQKQGPMPGAVFKRLRELPPAQQQSFMANNPQFQQLPPERQEMIRKRLEEWNAKTPQEKEAIREREQQPNRQPNGAQQGQVPIAGDYFKRLRELPPAQQQRIMANNPQFQRLSPERQELIREHLAEWNAKSPQEKETIREREEIVEGLSPSQKQEARNIFPQWHGLTPLRRQAVMVAFRHLRDLPPDQRRGYLDSQDVREQFSPHERNILEGLNKLLPNSPSPAPKDPDQ